MRRTACSLLVLVTALAIVVVAPSSPAGAASRPALHLSPARPLLAEPVRVATRLPGRGVRPVVLQRARGHRWVRLARSRTDRAGRVRITIRATAPTTRLRVLAPRHRSGGRTHRQVVSAVRTLRARPGALTFSSALDGDRVDVTVTSTNVLAGRPVRYQAADADGRWRTLGSGRIRGTGTTRLDDVAPAADVRDHTLRVVAPRFKGAPAVVSPTRGPATAEVTATVDGQQVRITATARGNVDAVRFYGDGELLAVDRTAPWETTWTPTIGEHDVTARVVGQLQSTLVPGVAVETTGTAIGIDSGVAEGFVLEPVQSGLDLPTSAATLPTGAVLVTEKAGTVQVVEPTGESGWSLPREVLDLTDVVYDGGDAGLIGIAADPEFAVNGHVYLSYVRDETVAGDRRSQQVTRYTWDGDRLVPGSGTVVLGSATGEDCAPEAAIRTPDCLPMIGAAHTVGDLHFDEQGNLLVGVGDGALELTGGGLRGREATLRAQDPDVLAGKVLRVDPTTGNGVPGNPLYRGDGTDNASRVVALGLRNPFRFSVHDDLLIIGDVGEAAVEEIDVVDLAASLDRPENFGWPCREGDAPTDVGDVADPDDPWHVCAAVREDGAAAGPAYSYPHRDTGGSVSAGTFLDSAAYPSSMRGRYVFGDYAQNFIRTADVDHHGTVTAVAPFADASAAGGPVKFFTGPDDLVWSVSIATGSLVRLRWTGEDSGDQCEVGTFRRTFHDLDGPDSVFDREFPDDEWRWLYPYAAAQLPAERLGDTACTTGISLSTDGSPWLAEGESDQRDHPGDRFGTAWRGSITVSPGTYRFQVVGSEWMRLWVDDQLLHDFYASEFWEPSVRTAEIVLGRGQHVVRAEHVHGDETLAAADVGWERVGEPPTVELTAPANGVVTSDGRVAWQVALSDPDGEDPAQLAAGVVLEVDFLHFTGGSDGTFHSHPSRRISGELSGTLEVDDAHAPGNGIVRLRAVATDASGARGVSAPVYVCFPDGDVGPCWP
ncbi:PQQ-dependent sugar dehydrogenase [Nocardioides sambongensis]|uniref:PQQ-dependent sugar dehydrogenase n=1 Tax=Nocardioides sambongensis TaxID=2589074 RepID=UPI0011271215|nr:PQQ-dependent sugar dehydrogenase [Nocardioides sambongensis]